MGMYTEFHFNSCLKKDTPEEVINVLNYMLWVNEEKPKLPKHELFETDRWQVMLKSDSYYFDADTCSILRYDDIGKEYFLCIRSNLKNYCNEIRKFLDWIHPYLDKLDGDFLGFYRYEETEYPTLIWYRNDGIVVRNTDLLRG